MSTAAHVENLTDDAPAQPQTDPDPGLVAGGQLARVGRRHAGAVAGSAVADRVADLDAQPREEPGGSRDRADVRVRPVRREDLYEPRAPLGTRVLTAAARWLISSRGEVAERELDARLRDPAPNSRMNIATVTGQRGGVGKTSLVVTVGGLLADHSRLNVVALDADLDYGPLADHVPDAHRSEKTIVDLLADFDGDQPVAMPRLRPHLSRTPSGLRVLAAPRRREEMRELTAADLDRALALLSNFDLCLLDCAAGVERDLAPWATSRADRLIIVTTAEYVGARNVGRAISELPARERDPRDQQAQTDRRPERSGRRARATGVRRPARAALHGPPRRPTSPDARPSPARHRTARAGDPSGSQTARRRDRRGPQMRAASEHRRIAAAVAAGLIVLALAGGLAGRALGGAQPAHTRDEALRVADTQVARFATNCRPRRRRAQRFAERS